MHSASADSSSHSDSSVAHVVPVRVLLAVFGALMVLTAITVAVSYFDFGALNLWVAMGVASIKAALEAARNVLNGAPVTELDPVLRDFAASDILRDRP